MRGRNKRILPRPTTKLNLFLSIPTCLAVATATVEADRTHNFADRWGVSLLAFSIIFGVFSLLLGLWFAFCPWGLGFAWAWGMAQRQLALNLYLVCLRVFVFVFVCAAWRRLRLWDSGSNQYIILNSGPRN